MMNAARQDMICASAPATKGEADAARDPVPAERAPAVSGVADEPGGADRVVDRAKQPGRRETERERDRAARQASGDRRTSGPDKKHDHHMLGAPAVAEPSRRQCTKPKQHKAAERQRQKLAIAHAPALPRSPGGRWGRAASANAQEVPDSREHKG